MNKNKINLDLMDWSLQPGVWTRQLIAKQKKKGQNSKEIKKPVRKKDANVLVAQQPSWLELFNAEKMQFGLLHKHKGPWVIPQEITKKQKTLLPRVEGSQFARLKQQQYKDKKQRVSVRESGKQQYKDKKQRVSVREFGKQQYKDKKQRVSVRESSKQQYKDKKQRVSVRESSKQQYKDKKQRVSVKGVVKPQYRDKKQRVSGGKQPYKDKQQGVSVKGVVKQQYRNKKQGVVASVNKGKQPAHFNNRSFAGRGAGKPPYKKHINWQGRSTARKQYSFNGRRRFTKRFFNQYRKNKQFRLLPMFYKLRFLLSQEKLEELQWVLPKVVAHRRRRDLFFNYTKKFFPSIGSGAKFTENEMLRYTFSLKPVIPQWFDYRGELMVNSDCPEFSEGALYGARELIKDRYMHQHQLLHPRLIGNKWNLDKWQASLISADTSFWIKKLQFLKILVWKKKVIKGLTQSYTQRWFRKILQQPTGYRKQRVNVTDKIYYYYQHRFFFSVYTYKILAYLEMFLASLLLNSRLVKYAFLIQLLCFNRIIVVNNNVVNNSFFLVGLYDTVCLYNKISYYTQYQQSQQNFFSTELLFFFNTYWKQYTTMTSSKIWLLQNYIKNDVPENIIYSLPSLLIYTAPFRRLSNLLYNTTAYDDFFVYKPYKLRRNKRAKLVVADEEESEEASSEVFDKTDKLDKSKKASKYFLSLNINQSLFKTKVFEYAGFYK